MGLPNRIIKLAEQQIGVKEEPSNSSNVKYNTLYYGGPVNGPQYHWCVVFIWWLFRQLGMSSRFYDGKKTASCGTYLNWARMKGITLAGPKVGSLVLFDWTGDGKPDHIELVTAFTKDTITSIGGNTGPKSDSVLKQTRSYDNVLEFIWPYYEGDDKVTLDEFKELMAQYRAELQDNDAWNAEESVKARQFCIDNGIIVGGDPLPDGSPNYMYQDFLNREQMAIMLKRFYDKFIEGR